MVVQLVGVVVVAYLAFLLLLRLSEARLLYAPGRRALLL